jgi:hypothetical protein
MRGAHRSRQLDERRVRKVESAIGERVIGDVGA